MNLRGKVAMVTGSGRGIGRSVARMLADAGAKVVLVARTMAEIRKVESELRTAGGTAAAFAADVSDEKQVDALFAAARKRFKRLDILVNNAGIGLYGKLADFSAADFDRVLAVNLRGTFLCCRGAMKMMMPRRSGYIINVSSVVGFKGYPNQSAYTASKHGVMGLTKSLAVEAQEHGIQVSVILPGGVDTRMARQARPDLKPAELLRPADIAQAVGYLLSLSPRAAVDEIYVRRRHSRPF